MNDEETPAETPTAFLIILGDKLSKMKDVDVGLVDILKSHVLKADSAQDAVVQAKTAILKLASERAHIPKAEVVNG